MIMKMKRETARKWAAYCFMTCFLILLMVFTDIIIAAIRNKPEPTGAGLLTIILVIASSGFYSSMKGNEGKKEE
jgi:hypothetical protein